MKKELFVEKARADYNWAEGLIYPSGDILFARPSHLILLEREFCKKYKASRDELYGAMPESESPIIWLCNILSIITTHNSYYITPRVISLKQRQTLRYLMLSGLLNPHNNIGRFPIVQDSKIKRS